LRHKGIADAAAKDRLESARSGREVARAGVAGYVGVAGSIHGDAVARVIVIAAEVGGIDERGSGGVELRDESVVSGRERAPADENRLEGPSRYREVDRSGPASYVGAAS